MTDILWVLKVIICSICLIALIHYLFNYLKNTFTIPKVKYLDTHLTEKYENIYNIIQKEPSISFSPPIVPETTIPFTQNNIQENFIEGSSSSTSIDNLPVMPIMNDTTYNPNTIYNPSSLNNETLIPQNEFIPKHQPDLQFENTEIQREIPKRDKSQYEYKRNYDTYTSSTNRQDDTNTNSNSNTNVLETSKNELKKFLLDDTNDITSYDLYSNTDTKISFTEI